MKNRGLRPKTLVLTTIIAFVLSLTALCPADTFKHKTSEKTYQGYAEQDPNNGKTAVYTTESGKLLLNLSEYEIIPNDQGRNRFVSVLSLDSAIEYEIVTAAFEKAMVEESNKGPLFIAIEIDCPGGRVDLATRMCSAITKMHNCQSVAFIKGGPEGGAYSGAAAVALACNKIYMSGATVIGAATVIDGRGYDLEKTRGVNLSEKIRSAWRNYMASLAEQNHRPVAFARAMENKDIEILEVRRDGKTHYIESGEKKSTDSVVRVRKPKGQIVTLPAGEAVEYGVADKVVSSLQDVLADRNATDANVIRPNQMTLAKEEFDKVNRKFEKLKNSLDTKFHTLSAKSRNGGITINDAKKAFKGIIQEMKYLIRLKKTYPDVPCEEEDLQDTINAIQAEYESL